MIRPVLLSLSLLLPLPAAAQDQTPLRTLELSKRLYEAGRDARDALLVIAAARLRKQVTVAPRPDADAAPQPGARAMPQDGQQDGPLGWEQMLADAATFAGEDGDLAGIIADVHATQHKGIVSGPVYSIAVLPAGETARFGPYPFAGGRYAEVYVEGDGSADLNLYVHDAEGRLICADTDLSDIAYCGWRPAGDGVFTITVENAGAAENRYALMTN